MKLQLSKHFQTPDSPFKLYMENLKREKKQTINRRFTSKSNNPKSSSIQFTNSLNEELDEYSKQFDKTGVVPKSKAYAKMKKLIVEQERRLKHIRLEEIKRVNTSVRTELPESTTTFLSQGFLSSIPETNNLFKNQMRDTMIYQNSILNKTLEDRVHSLNDTVKYIRGYESLEPKTLPIYEPELDIDSVLEMHRERNRNLITTLKNQKKQIKQNRKYKKENELLPTPTTTTTKPIQKTTIRLNSLKSVEIKRLGGATRNVSPSIALLFEINNLKSLKDKKETELHTLLQNEHQNRDRNIDDKTSFYSDNVTLKTLNPSVQFKMRKIMNDKLMHRLKASKDQALTFGEFLVHLKETRTIVCDALQEVFEEIRGAMAGGKLLREEDYYKILGRFGEYEELGEPVNVNILKKVKNMMI